MRSWFILSTTVSMLLFIIALIPQSNWAQSTAILTSSMTKLKASYSLWTVKSCQGSSNCSNMEYSDFTDSCENETNAFLGLLLVTILFQSIFLVGMLLRYQFKSVLKILKKILLIIVSIQLLFALVCPIAIVSTWPTSCYDEIDRFLAFQQFSGISTDYTLSSGTGWELTIAGLCMSFLSWIGVYQAIKDIF